MDIKIKSSPSRSALRAGGLSSHITLIFPRKLISLISSIREKQGSAKQVLIALLIIGAAVSVILSTSKEKTNEVKSVSAIGQLILNTDKSVYSQGDDVYIQITALDENGKANCSANLDLTINHQLSEPEGSLSQRPYTIHHSPSCGSTSLNPDYYAYFKPEAEGDYTLTLKNTDNGSAIESSITVSSPNPLNTPISISRWGPTRIGASDTNRYPMIITVTAGRDFRGKVTDSLPNNFSFAWIGNAKTEEIDGRKTITWDVNLLAGETAELKYEYTVDEKTTGDFKLGPVEIYDGKTVFDEKSPWNVISI